MVLQPGTTSLRYIVARLSICNSDAWYFCAYSGPSEDATPYINASDGSSLVYRDEKVASRDALPWATYTSLNNILSTPQGWARFPIKNLYAASV